MKIAITMLAITLALLSENSLAGNKNQALTACKAHIKTLYQTPLRTSVKKVRQRKGFVEVKMKVSNNGERFTAMCRIDSTGRLEYSRS